MEETLADRDTEKRSMVFQLRAQAFVTLYQAGDRLLELARKDFPEEAWKFASWTKVEAPIGCILKSTVNTPSSEYPVIGKSPDRHIYANMI